MTYSRDFYARTSRTAHAGASRIVPLIFEALRPKSVLDVGAGGGAWLEAWSRSGVGEFKALDQATIGSSGYCLPAHTFAAVNLAEPFDLGRRFALVQSLEVAEHLPPASAEGFIASLCRHGDVVLFSAAPPGQGGVHHVNEQPFEYWRARFKSHGFRPLDWLRPKIGHDRSVAWWYRYNILLYANDTAMNDLPASVRATRVPDHKAIEDVASVGHRLRRLLLRPLPECIVTRLALAAERGVWAANS